jgi:restriction endonuclease S subunit/predicted ATPase
VSEQPMGWAITTISDITEYLSRGKQPKYVRYSSLPVINQRAIRWSGIQNEYLKYVDPIQADQWTPEKFVRPGDILWNSTGTGTLGRACLITQRDLEPPKVVDSHVTIVRPIQAAVDPRFLFSWIQSSEVQKKVESLATGATNQIELGRAMIASMRIPIAPLNEQKRIADKLDDFLARVEACRDRLDHVSLALKCFRQSVLSAATSGELTKDWRVSNKRSFDWERVHLSDVGQIGRGKSKHRPRNDSRLYGGPYPFIQTGDVTQSGGLLNTHSQTYSEFGLSQSKLWPTGTVCITIAANIGDTAILTYPACFPDSIVGFVADPQKCIPHFLKWSIDMIRDDLQASAPATAQKNINLSILNEVEFYCPPYDEQYEVVRRVEALFDYADRIEAFHHNAYEQLERLIPALLDKAFRGELVEQDPNDEPASILLEKIKVEKIRMESEQKTERAARRSTKQTSKAPMKQPSDYLEALRNAFEASGKTTDARQLFDQAGFSPEDVVPFYEALRVDPEIRATFANPRGKSSPQLQNNTTTITSQPPSENRRFRLIELWLEDFKNLTDYTVRFNPAHSIDVVLGWNGTGKSNLFEALVIIFRDLSKWYEKNQWPKIPMKGYQLRYIIDGKTVEISWCPGEMKRPKLTMQLPQDNSKDANKPKTITRVELPLPRFIFGYYSGPTNRLAEHFLPMKQDHYERLLKATSDDPDTLTHLLEQRQFFCAENHHAKYVLLAFCHKEDADISRFLEDRLRIVGFESALFIIRKPRWAKKGQTAEDFWGAQGIMRRVMERLRRFAIAPMVVEQTVPDGFRSQREDHYYFFLPDLQSLHDFAAEYQDARTFFLALESTDFSELIYDVKIQVRIKSTNTEEVPITFHELSEGEQQLLMVLGLMRFTKSHQSLVLLDEPDTHLNPHWSIEYLKLLTRLMSEDANQSEEQQTSQILMSTHDPLVIASLFKEQIHLLRRDWQTGVCKWNQPSVNPRGLGFTGILTSEMFGMRSDLDEETLADLDNKVRLVAKEGSMTPDELKELEEINKRLEDAGFQKAFSDPYYAAFIRAWSQRHNELMAGVRFLNPAQQQEVDRIAREVLEEVMLELQAEAVG